MAVTIHDIANRVGVNASTVSRALNNKDNVSEKTKKRIHRIAQSLGYSPNRVARGLVTKETGTLGLVMPAIRCIGHTLFCSMLEGIYESAHELGYSLSFSVVDVNIQGEEAAVRNLEEYRVDGLILGWFKEQYMEETRLVELAKRNIPFVIIGDRHIFSHEINMIACDNFIGAYKATNHLIHLGHRKIALISGSSDDPIVIDRFAGFKAAMNQIGIDCSEEYIQKYMEQGGFYITGSGETAMYSLLDKKGDFTAIFAFSDMFAAEAIRAIQRRGYNVPNDYAVVGFDDAEYGSLLNPRLTTIQQPYREIGKESVLMLKKLIDHGPLEKNRVLVEPQLIIRESCGIQNPICSHNN